jgi:hypothetical protein
MLEEDYSRELNRLLGACECDVAVPSEWRERAQRKGVIPPVEGDRRQFVRHYFHRRVILEFGQTFPAIPRQHTVTQAVTGDLSRSGISFLHSEQLFPGERVSLWLPDGKRSYTVARCTQRNESCFEIGAVLSDAS